MARTPGPARRRITLDLEDGVLTALDATASAVKESRSGFIVAAIERRLREVNRARVDAAFAEMASDPDYQAELRTVESAMAPASDSAWLALDAAEAPAVPARTPPSRKRHRAPR